MGKEEKRLMNSIAACFEILAYDKAKDLQDQIWKFMNGKGSVSVEDIGRQIGVSLNTLTYLASRMPEVCVDAGDKWKWYLDTEHSSNQVL